GLDWLQKTPVQTMRSTFYSDLLHRLFFDRQTSPSARTVRRRPYQRTLLLATHISTRSCSAKLSRTMARKGLSQLRFTKSFPRVGVKGESLSDGDILSFAT